MSQHKLCWLRHCLAELSGEGQGCYYESYENHLSLYHYLRYRRYRIETINFASFNPILVPNHLRQSFCLEQDAGWQFLLKK